TSTPPTRSTPLPLHDALPISASRKPATGRCTAWPWRSSSRRPTVSPRRRPPPTPPSVPRRLLMSQPSLPPAGAHAPRRFPEILRSEEHTSELQSRGHLVCRLL